MTKKPTMDRVRVLFADQLNLARGKYLPREFAKGGHARFCAGAYAVTFAKGLVPAPGADVMDGLPDLAAVFDPDNLRRGWEPGTDIALADVHGPDGPSELCGRSALKRVLDKWKAHGLTPMIGIEGEAYIFQKGDSGDWVPYDTPGAYVYGTGPFIDPEGLIDDIWATAQDIGVRIESFNAEYDTPQFELTLGYEDALSACDNFFLFRQMAREILYRKGYLLSFMPKPIKEVAGSGMHINISFINEDGDNAFAGCTDENNLSDLVRGCVAGLIKHHESMCAILAPLTNSYDRLGPGSLSGYWANWGHDHRGVAVRISGEKGKAARIEHRVGDCAASPYFAVAAILNAALLGYEKGYDLPPAETGDCLEHADATRHVPASLKQALALLKSDTDLTKAIGQRMIDNYLTIKEAEIAETKGKDASGIFDYYAPFI